jgi:Transglycosylase SLT domain
MRLRSLSTLVIAGVVACVGSVVTPANALPGTVTRQSPAPQAVPPSDGSVPRAPGAHVPTTQAQVPDPDRQLGPSWRKSDDVLVTGVGDNTGFHVYVARERDAFRWSLLATLSLPGWDSGPWTGYTCVTGSGRYAVAVYAPSYAVNRPALLQAGAFAAVVDVTTGRVTPVRSEGVALEYFSPACGASDEVLLTRSLGEDEQQTDLVHVDATSGRVLRTTRVDAQVTTPAPTPDGDYGIAHGKLVRIDDHGRLQPLATPAGRAIAVHASGSGGIDMLSLRGNRTIAERWAAGRLTRIGDAPADRLQLFGMRGGRNALVGKVDTLSTASAPELVAIPADRHVMAISTDGHLLAEEVIPRQLVNQVKQGPGAAREVKGGTVGVTVVATHSGARTTAEVTANDTASPSGVAPAAEPPNLDTPMCAVPRNDPTRQALQPTAQMVEWAADLAVHGSLTISRPANYLHTGEPSYTPQGMFPSHSLVGGGTVPAQLLMAIFAQESNFRQATFHGRPGDGANPLIANYYGTINNDLNSYDYNLSDCGYGIGQVTDGMGAFDVTRTAAQQVAIATDYAANIAAALQILQDKWNQIASSGLFVNNGDPRYIENWFLAAWAYNSGFHEKPVGGGNWGVGWFNNPANPRYPATRHPFLRDSLNDASHPADWPYEEKVMGWAETPQRTYFSQPSYPTPNFGVDANSLLSLPTSLATFCEPDVNNCDINTTPDPCPSEDDSCWWHQSTAWVDSCQNLCATESLTYVAGAPEPPMVAQYTPDCDVLTGAIVVDDLPDSSLNVVGCPGHTSGGKFTLRTGDGTNPTATLGQIDLHQLGAAYGGHMYFTHVYNSNDLNHLVSGTWIPDGIPTGGEIYDILAHMPDHGGDTTVARYRIDTGTGSFTASSTISQETDGVNEWVAVGQFTLHPGARVQLRNDLGGTGTIDIAFDALAFIPLGPALAETAQHSRMVTPASYNPQLPALPPASRRSARTATRRRAARSRRSS